MTKVRNRSIGELLSPILIILLFSCSTNEGEDEMERPAPNSRDSIDAPPSARDTASYSTDNHRLVVPGTRIGQTRIGQSLDDVNSILGEPDSGDAGMGRVWQYRHSRDSSRGRVHELDIYATFDSLATAHYVRLIRITSPWFTTKEGIRTGSSFDKVREGFPQIVPIAKYRDGSSRYVVYDAEEEGIAFEFILNGNDTPAECTGIVVHEAGRDILHAYIPRREYAEYNPRK